MPLFRYKALANDGKKITGVIDADSLNRAKEKLRAQKILVTKLTSLTGDKEVVLSPAHLLAFTRELSQLLKAGLPLYESLLTIEEKHKKHKTHPLYLDLCDKLKTGHSLSRALSHYPKSFDTIYLSMVQAGEKSGSLSWAFEQLFGLIEKKQTLKRQLVSAMAYPAFLASFCFLVICGLLLFVIPSMSELFEERALHPLTHAVLSLSRFVQDYSLLLVLTLSLSIGGFLYLFKKRREQFLMGALRVPLIKTILTQASIIRFCKSASVLLFGGVPLTTTLTIARNVMNHPPLQQTIQRAETKILEGSCLSVELTTPGIPPLVGRMVSIAEETGRMPEMLQSLSDIYDQELERSLRHITTFLQPILLLIIGGLVGLVVLAILLPLTDVSSLITT